VVVDAAASTTDAMKEIGAAWEKSGGAPVDFSFGASSELARQIEAGARVDVFVSADEAKMDALQNAGLVRAEDRRDLLSNRLVVVVASGSNVAVSSVRELGTLSKIATAETTSVPLGIYARSWLTKVGVWDAVAPHVVATVDARGALAAIESESVDAAIVYRTDALASKKVRVVLVAAEADAPRIVFPVSRLANATSPSAQSFVDFLSSPDARRIFEAHGFFVL
jgi:molybdate transport system substrate-binding protein